MAILAVFAAIASLMGGRIHADAMLDQTRETDQWAQYQAKVIRQRSYEVFLDELSVFSIQNAAQAGELKARYASEIKRYDSETKDIQTEAEKTAAEVETLERRSNWFDFAEILLEASLVICSITLLTRKRVFWYVGMAAGLTGFCLGVAGMFLH
jgi:hypothetical protein